MLERAAFPRGSHNEKALLEILDTYPRDELFQISDDELFDVAMGILHLGERQRLRLFARRDPFGRFFSLLVFVPRDRFNTENRRRIEAILRTATGAATIDYTTRVSESVLVRLHFVAYVEPGVETDFDAREVEMMLVAATRSWADDLEEALDRGASARRSGGELFQRYGDAFPAAYRADWVARSALADIVHVEELPEADGLGISLYRPLEAGPRMLRAKLFRAGRPLMLSDVLPLFENMGVEVADERPYPIAPRGRDGVWIYDFGLTYSGGGDLDTGGIRESFQDTFVRAWRGEVENDAYNRLVLGAALTWREITVLRAIGKYLRQARITYSDSYVEQALVAQPGDRAAARGAVPGALRPAPHRPRGRRGDRRADRRGDRRGREPRPGPDPPHVPRGDPGDPANELLPDGPHGGGQPPVVQARPDGAPVAAPAAPAVRDLRVLAPHGGRAPARRRRWRAAASGGPTGARTSAPRCSA